MRKIIIPIVLLLSGCSYESSNFENEQYIEELQEEITNLQVTIEELEEQVSDLEMENYDLQSEIDDLQSQIDEYEFGTSRTSSIKTDNNSMEAPSTQPSINIAVNDFIKAFSSPFAELKASVNKFNQSVNNNDFQGALKTLDEITSAVEVMALELGRIKYKDFERHYKSINSSLTEMKISDAPIRMLLSKGNSNVSMYNKYDANIKTIQYSLESLELEFQ